MPIARFQMPDGRIGRFQVPDGTTPQAAQAMIQQQFQAPDPTGSFTENLAAGAGKAVADVGRGAGQMLRSALPDSAANALRLPTQADIDEARRLDAPLMKTVGGKVGDVAGNVAMFAPTSMIPGANTITGQALVGGAMGALQPTSADESRLTNTLVGAGTGAALKYGGDKASNYFAQRAAQKATQGATQQAQNATRDAALKAGQEAGFVVPPSTINPSLTNQAAESVAGKYATAQTASVNNAKIVDTLGRQSLGLSPDAQLTEASLATMRKNAGQAYQAVKDFDTASHQAFVGGAYKFPVDATFRNEVNSLGGDISAVAKEFPELTKNEAVDTLKTALSKKAISPTAAVELTKKLRYDAGVNFKAFDDPAKLALAKAQRGAADALDGLVERSLTSQGQPELASSYNAARTTIAKAHDIESALMPDGHINAQVLAKIGESGKLTGPLKTIADFASNFPKAVQPVSKIGSPAITTLRTSIGTAAGAGIGGIPGAMIGGAVAYGTPWTARQMLLSGPGQALMASPSYATGAGSQTVSNLLTNPALRTLGTEEVLRRRNER